MLDLVCVKLVVIIDVVCREDTPNSHHVDELLFRYDNATVIVEQVVELFTDLLVDVLQLLVHGFDQKCDFTVTGAAIIEGDFIEELLPHALLRFVTPTREFVSLHPGVDA